MQHLTNYQLYPLFSTWLGIRQRCTDPACPAYPDYGGRGILMCERWALSVDAFIVDMGPRPADHSIDRIDVNGHYEPSNCQWATREQQARNKRNTRITDDDVREIVAAVQRGVPLSHIPLVYPVTRQYVQRLVDGSVRRVEGIDYVRRDRSTAHAKKLTAADVQAIRTAYAAGTRPRDLAVKFGIHRNNVHRILNGKSWAQTTDKHPSSSK